MAVKKGLGRGLDILLPEMEEAPKSTMEIALGDIDPNPDQPRREFDKEALQQLADSIAQSGVLQPLLVVKEGMRYRIVAGERRYRAARMAGLHTVPCLVKDMNDQEIMEAALIENLQREDLNPIEEAAGIRALMDKCGYTQEMAAKRVGRSRPAVANILRLLNLPAKVQKLVKDGKLSAGHARVLAGMDNKEAQLELAELTVKKELSVRELEKLAADWGKEAPVAVKPPLPLELEDMRERLQNALGVRTMLRGSMKKGKVILQYNSTEELEAIYAAMERLEK
ncbi:MAG: ParB/RepB/Spo0J family partition protein [Clostridia bacterium]|nr:ParB/RepB/Spo0J family partition protein [Clostridia bacterium]